MKASKTVVVLASLIVVLSLVAASVGIFYQDNGSPFEFKTLRGETVMIQGRGLYKYDSVSFAAQGIAQDVVTLLVGIPLLVVSIMLYRRESFRGKLLLAGTLGYFLYTYMSYAFGVAYNGLFLLYVALFSLSLSAFVLSIGSIDVATLPAHFSEKLPRRLVSTLLFAVGGFLVLAWSGRIGTALLDGSVPYGLESYSTLPLQAMDLGLIVPLAFVSGILLLRRSPWGYLLSSVALIKGFTMSVALIAMIVGEMLAGVQVYAGETIMFLVLTLSIIAVTFLFLKRCEASAPSPVNVA
jgi:hypothetical protein